MKEEEIYINVAINALQGILEGKGGFVGDALPTLLAKDAFRIADAFMRELHEWQTNQETLWKI